MTFSVDDFQDLMRLLGQHPEWRDELRRQLLTDELLSLPALVRQLVQAQARTDQQLAHVAERLDTLTAQVESLTQAQARTDQQLATLTAQVESLTQAQARTSEQLATLTLRVDALDARVGRMYGRLVELEYDRRAPAYFAPIARRLRVIDPGRLANLLDDAVDDGRLTWAERMAVMLADVVLTGRRLADRAEVYLLVEVSVGVGLDDVHRAADRADILSKLGRPVLPVVAGESIIAEAGALARDRGVWQAVDGQVTEPIGA